jgi:hypothetical protein
VLLLPWVVCMMTIDMIVQHFQIWLLAKIEQLIAYINGIMHVHIINIASHMRIINKSRQCIISYIFCHCIVF